MFGLFKKKTKGDWSGFGYEFTFRLAKPGGDQAPPRWPIDVLVSMARAAFMGQRFAPGHTAKTGPIDGNPDGRITALIEELRSRDADLVTRMT